MTTTPAPRPHDAIARNAIIALIDNAIDEMHDRDRDDIADAIALAADAMRDSLITLHNAISATIAAPLTPADEFDLIDLIDDPALPACCTAALTPADALYDMRLTRD